MPAAPAADMGASAGLLKGADLGKRVRQIEVGDRVVACDVHRGEVILVGRSRSWLLLRVDAGEPTRSGYLLCQPAEVERMNGWWARRLRRAGEGRVGRRAWVRGAERPVVAGRPAPQPVVGAPLRSRPDVNAPVVSPFATRPRLNRRAA